MPGKACIKYLKINTMKVDIIFRIFRKGLGTIGARRNSNVRSLAGIRRHRNNMSWLSKDVIARAIPDFVFLSVVTSLALNTTVQLRLRDERNREFMIQRELLRRLRDQLRISRRRTLSDTPNICKQLVLAGLRPSDYGFEGVVVKDAEETTKAHHPHLSWYEVFFTGRALSPAVKIEPQDFGSEQWEQDFLRMLEELDKAEAQPNA